MMNYPYIHPTPFIKAQRYDYADCASEDFISAWEQSRKTAIERYKTLSQKTNSDNQSSPAENNSIEAILTQCIEKKDSDVFWIFLKKFEVFGKFHSHYSVDFRKTEQAGPADIDAYILFGKALIAFWNDSHCYQFPSTLLKLIDGFCGWTDTSDLPPDSAREIVDLFQQEQILIRDLR